LHDEILALQAREASGKRLKIRAFAGERTYSTLGAEMGETFFLSGFSKMHCVPLS
jgi:hypothetical protein